MDERVSDKHITIIHSPSVNIWRRQNLKLIQEELLWIIDSMYLSYNPVNAVFVFSRC